MILTDSERSELQQQVNARNVRADVVRRARLILLLADKHTWEEIRAKLDCSNGFIALWHKRFSAERLAGLYSRHAGRSAFKVTDRLEARVLART
ncbi:helix-turn-helix domain-containing protein, partial [Pseudoduganella violaceinigra]|uniref:helix-turn-helix domain-containing protein n=2 Tax=Pseudoduganella violaceinigra TaxID=246602 RepID=UPI00054F875C